MNHTEEERQIMALLCEYCDSVDRGDLDGFAGLFANGAWGIAGDLALGAAAVRAVLDNVIIYDGTPNTRHLMSNVQITVGVGEESGSATARCCITVMQCVPGDFPLQAIFIGTYLDKLQKREGRWQFIERVIEPNLIGDMSRHRSDMA